MTFLIDAIVTNNTTGKMTPKAWTMEAANLDSAYDNADSYIGGNESLVIKNICTVSDFSHY